MTCLLQPTGAGASRKQDRASPALRLGILTVIFSISFVWIVAPCGNLSLCRSSATLLISANLAIWRETEFVRAGPGAGS